MMPEQTHIIVLPYYCQDEVARYLTIARQLADYPRPDAQVHYLLASSPRTEPSQELEEAYSSLGPCTSIQCPTQIFGYPQGPTAMYWDAMEYVAEKFEGNRGFCLWLESDMCPVKPDWIDRLSSEWFSGERPLMMGCYVPEVYKNRILRGRKKILDPHINGGACYATDFARRLPPAARSGVFDMAVYQYAAAQNGVRPTTQIAFSTLGRVRRDVMNPEKVLLHGFMQDKDQFIDACLQPVSSEERAWQAWHPVQESWERMKRRMTVMVVRRGHRAMLENMLLAQDQWRSQKRAG